MFSSFDNRAIEIQRTADDAVRRVAEETTSIVAPQNIRTYELKSGVEGLVGLQSATVGERTFSSSSGNAVDFVQQYITDPILVAITGAQNPVTAATNAILAVGDSLFNVVRDRVESIVDDLIPSWVWGAGVIKNWIFDRVDDLVDLIEDLTSDALNLISPYVETAHYAATDYVIPFADDVLKAVENFENAVNDFTPRFIPDLDLGLPGPFDWSEKFRPMVERSELVRHETVNLQDWTVEEVTLVADVGAAAQIGFADLSLLEKAEEATGESLYIGEVVNGETIYKVDDDFVYENVDWNDRLIDWARERYDIIRVEEATNKIFNAITSDWDAYQSNVALIEHKQTGEYWISIGGTDRIDGLEDIWTDVVLWARGSTAGSAREIETIIDGFFEGGYIPEGAHVNLTGGSLGGGEALLQYRDNPELYDHVYPTISIGYGGLLGTSYDRNIWNDPRDSMYQMGDPNITEVNGNDPGSDFNDLVTGTGHVGAGKTFWMPDVIQDPDLPVGNIGTKEFWDVHNPHNIWYTVSQAHPEVFENIGGGTDPQPSNAVLETGTVTLSHKKTTVNLQNTFENPLAIAFVATENGVDPVNVRISEVEGNELTLQLDEPNYLDGWHVFETVNFVVVEEGSWVLEDGTVFEAGTINTNKLTSNGFETVNFDAEFDTRPVVLSQVQTFNGVDFVTTRQSPIGNDGFRLTMQEEEKLNNGGHITETLGWFAIEAGEGSSGDFDWIAGRETGVTHRNSNVDLAVDFSDTINAVASLSSFNGPDTAWARGNGTFNEGFAVSVEEERSRDREVGHTWESIDYFAFNESDVISAYAYDSVA